MPTVLFVCTANICRSPVAEWLLKRELQMREMSDWRVGSAGTWATWARSAARYSQEVALANGGDLSGHTARMVDQSMLDAADLVLCMESGHVEALRAEFASSANKVFLLSEMVGRRYDISDPYGGPPELYERMLIDLAKIIQRGFSEIVTRASESDHEH